MNKYQNILVSRTDKIGDVILTLPVLSEIKRLLPDSRLSFLVSNKLGDLLKDYEDIDNLYFIEDCGSDLVGFLKSEKFDAGISVFPRFNIALAMFLARIKTRVGTAYRFYSPLFNVRFKEHRKYAVKHESDYNLNLLSFLNENISYDKVFKFKYSDSDFLNLKTKLNSFNINSRYVIVHPGSKGSAVDLPVEKLMSVVDYIINNFLDFKVVITGSVDDKPVINSFIEKFGDNVSDVSGLLTLKELLIFIDNSYLFISNSTGPIHIAGALNKNIIGFYPNSAPVNAVRWRPLSINTEIISPDSGDDMNSIPFLKIKKSIDGFLIN